MTNKELIKQYCNTGIPISKEQFNQLNNQDKKTYLRARFNAFKINKQLMLFELENFNEEQKTFAANKIVEYGEYLRPKFFYLLTPENKRNLIFDGRYDTSSLMVLEEINKEDFIFALHILKDMFRPGRGGETLQYWYKEYGI